MAQQLSYQQNSLRFASQRLNAQSLRNQPLALQPTLKPLQRTGPVQPNNQASIDPNMIAETIRRHFSVQLRPLNKPVYRKSYPKWIKKTMPLLREFEILNFTIFSGKDKKSTMEHISQFTAQCGKANQNEYYKLQLFLLFLIATTFTWYWSLPPNSM